MISPASRGVRIRVSMWVRFGTVLEGKNDWWDVFKSNSGGTKRMEERLEQG